MNKELRSCRACGEGKLHPRTETNEAEYCGIKRSIPLYFSVCDACGSELAGAEEMLANKREMIAFRKDVDGLLSGKDVRAIRKKLGLSQAQAANIFGGGPVAFSKYENDDLAPSEAMDKLLRVAGAVPDAFAWLVRHAGEARGGNERGDASG